MIKKTILFRHKPMVRSLVVRATAIAIKTLQVFILVRVYDAEVFGAYSAAIGLFLISMVLGRLGLDQYSLREANCRTFVAYRETMRLSLVVTVPSLAIAIVTMTLTKFYYSEEVFRSFALFVLAAPIYAIMWNQLFILRGFGMINASLLLFEIFNPVMLITSAYLFREYDYGLQISFITSISITAIITYLTTRSLRCHDDTSSHRIKTVFSSIQESRSFYSFAILDALQSLADGLAVGFFLQPAQMTTYTVISRMGNVILMPISITSIYGCNIVARLRSAPIPEIIEALRPNFRVEVAMSALISIGVFASQPIVENILNIEFSTEAKWALAIIIIAFFIEGTTNYARIVALMSGREHYLTWISASFLLPYIAALVILTEKFGLVAVGVCLLSYKALYRMVLVTLIEIEVSRFNNKKKRG